MTLADALRAQARVLEALADEAEARVRPGGGMELLTDAEVADELHIGLSEAARMRHAGKFGLPVYLSPKRPRVTRQGLERFKEAAGQKRSVA